MSNSYLPDPMPEVWFGIDFRNLAGFNRRGAKTWDTRAPAIIADIEAVNRDVVCVVELPDPRVAAFSAGLESAGYEHAAGGRGRHIYVRTGIHTVGAKILDLRPRLHGDDKQGVAVQVDAGSTPALVVTAHLENQDRSGDIQVAQAASLIDQAEVYAGRRGIPMDSIVWALDTNTEHRVRELFEARGYADVFDVGHWVENTEYRSLIPWRRTPSRGRRIDLIAVHASRPVCRAHLRLEPVVSDHLGLFADIGVLPPDAIAPALR